MNRANFHIVRCSGCGAANRIPADKIGTAAKCGKCRKLLSTEQKKAASGEAIKMRCTECKTKNKIPADKIDAGARCGKCGAALKTEALYEPQPLMITDSNFADKVMKSPLPVLLFAWAPWCPTCGSVAPVMEQFAADATGRVRVGKLNGKVGIEKGTATLEDVWTQHTRNMAQYGFDRLLYGLTMFRSGTGPGRLGAPEDLLVRKTAPGRPESSFVVQFPLYMCHPCVVSARYHRYVAAQARADHDVARTDRRPGLRGHRNRQALRTRPAQARSAVGSDPRLAGPISEGAF